MIGNSPSPELLARLLSNTKSAMRTGSLTPVCMAIDPDTGWLYARHADGQWVTISQVGPWTMELIKHGQIAPIQDE